MVIGKHGRRLGITVFLFSLGNAISAQRLEFAIGAGGVDSTYGDQCGGIAVDTSGNILITGHFNEQSTFGANEPNETTLTSAPWKREIFIAKYAAAGSLSWAQKVDSADNAEGRAIAVDGRGNSFITGFYRDSATFGAGQPNETTLTQGINSEAFLAKYDANGQLAWAKQVVGPDNDDVGNSVAVDGSGCAYTTGFFRGTATFGFGEPNEVTYTGDQAEIYLARYAPTGMLEWAAHIQGTSTLSAKDDVGLGVACDHFGNTYVTGFFNHSAVFGLGEPNETALFGTGAEIFIAKYTPVGTLAWAKVAGGPHSDAGKGIAVDEAGNSYVTGFFIDTSTFASGEINETTVVGSFHDIFVAKYDPQGAFLWVNATSSSGGISQDQGQGIVVDGAGYSYFTGYYLGSTITFGVGTPNATTLQGQNRSIFLARCKPGGGFDWAVTAYGSGVDEGTGVAMDSGGNGYVSGFYENFAIFGQGQTNETMLSGPGDQIFFAKYRLIPSKKALYGGSLQSAPPASAPDSQ